MLELTGIYRRIYDAAVAATGNGATSCDDEDVARLLVGREALPQAAVRAALVDLGADWLNVRPVEREGQVVRVEVLGVEARPA